MPAHTRLRVAVVSALLLIPVTAQAYERELSSRDIREAYFLGKDTTFRSEQFLKDYVQTFPVPKRGVHVARIEIATPFKQVVDRARKSIDGYSPMQAEDDYRRQPPLVSVEVTLWLTPTFSAHTPYAIPAFGPIGFRDPNFWQAFEVRLEQGGEVEPRARRGRPILSCDAYGGCWLVGAVVTVDYSPEEVASGSTRVTVLTPDGQRVETEFDLGRLR